MKTLLGRSIIVLATVATFSLVTPSFADQPHMEAALKSLQEARAQLQQAEHNKAGWRVQAIKDLDKVIADVQAGIAAAD